MPPSYAITGEVDARIVRCSPHLEDAVRLAAAGFCQPITEALREDVRQHLEEGDMIYAVISDEIVVGYAIFRVWDDILYLGGVILDPEFQGRWIVRRTIRRAHGDAPNAKYLALRTQSLLMWVAGSKLCTKGKWGEVTYAAQLRTSPELDAIGQRVAELTECNYPVTISQYGGPLYGEKPVYYDANLQAWWDGICNFERGDAVIYVGRLPRPNQTPVTMPECIFGETSIGYTWGS